MIHHCEIELSAMNSETQTQIIIIPQQIYERKMIPKIDTTNNSSRLIDQLEYLKSQESKTPAHKPAYVGSVR